MDVICVERVLEPFRLVMKTAHFPPVWASVTDSVWWFTLCLIGVCIFLTNHGFACFTREHSNGKSAKTSLNQSDKVEVDVKWTECLCASTAAL